MYTRVIPCRLIKPKSLSITKKYYELFAGCFFEYNYYELRILSEPLYGKNHTIQEELVKANLIKHHVVYLVSLVDI